MRVNPMILWRRAWGWQKHEPSHPGMSSSDSENVRPLSPSVSVPDTETFLSPRACLVTSRFFLVRVGLGSGNNGEFSSIDWIESIAITSDHSYFVISVSRFRIFNKETRFSRSSSSSETYKFVSKTPTDREMFTNQLFWFHPKYVDTVFILRLAWSRVPYQVCAIWTARATVCFKTGITQS